MWRIFAILTGGLGIAHAQTTQALLAGRIVDSITGEPVAAAEVAVEGSGAGPRHAARSGPGGYFSIPLLSPGVYRVRISSPGYQPQELHEQEVAVAGRLDYEIRLRPLGDVWEKGRSRSVFLPGRTVLPFFGPDVDFSRSGSFQAAQAARASLDATVSAVIDTESLLRLPLNGRDAYALIVAQPGAASDAATARGLGLTFNGQRPSASNFLLDGLENNNSLIAGPLGAVAPEAVGEYRVSTNNFSAEYGRTSGYLANVVTRAGGPRWHGLGYLYWNTAALNAASFQQNASGDPRPARRETQPGFSAGGPIVRDHLFLSGAFETLRLRGRLDPAPYRLPAAGVSPTGTAAAQLLGQYPATGAPTGPGTTALVTLAPPYALDRNLALARSDYLARGGLYRFLVRASIPKVRQPDFLWTPYRDFVTPLTQDTFSLGAAAELQLRPHLAKEIRLGWSSDDLRFDRPHPEIPTLGTGDGVTLPGSPAFYSYRNRSRNLEAVDNVIWSPGRHEVKFGGAVLVRRLDGYLTAGRDGYFGFLSFDDFTRDRAFTFYTALARIGKAKLLSPDYDREYRLRQWSLFVQDSFKVTPRLALHYGLRYERLGAPSNTGEVKDALLELGPGATPAARLASTATRVAAGAEGDQRLYDPDTRNFAPRVGFSLGLRRGGGTVVRGSFGIFYDRPFDNQWQNLRNNNLLAPSFNLSTASTTNYLGPVTALLAGQQSYQFGTYSRQFPDLTLYQPGLRNGYAQSWFLGVRHQAARNLVVEANALGSLSRRLVTTDVVNRDYSLPPAERGPGNGTGRLNPAFFNVNYRSNQGLADYNAFSLAARYRGGPVNVQAAYTWSHNIDNQSEPLAGDFFNLSFTRSVSPGTGTIRSAFSRQFDSRGDRGNSDFDQRHGFVLAAFADTPRVGRLGRWSFGLLLGVRSGFPYSAIAPPAFPPPANGQPMINIRADLKGPAEPSAAVQVPGGRQLLERSSFSAPPPGTQGNTGRNAFTGPGAATADLSLGRTLRCRRLGEAGQVTVRADAFNLLNHANLGQPANYLGSASFGAALYGRTGFGSSFPALAPFQENARRIQLLLRVQF
jgi:hypothetical protein